MSGNTLDTPRPAFSVDDAIRLTRQHYGLSTTAWVLDSERDQNFMIHCDDDRRFVLKIANAAEQPAVIDLQNAALLHIADCDPELMVPRLQPGNAGELSVVVEHDSQNYALRLISYMPGLPAGAVAVHPALQRSLGDTLARLGRALRGFFHPQARRELLWDLQQSSALAPLTVHVEQRAVRLLADKVFVRYATVVAPQLPRLRSQVIHNDFNPDNILIDRAAQRVTGIIDFGDIIHAPLIVDLAVACAYQLHDSDNPFSGVMNLLQAYHHVVALDAEELAVLFDLITTRVAATVTIASWRAAQYPDNRAYIMTSYDHAQRLLKRLDLCERDETSREFRRACGLPLTAHASRRRPADDAAPDLADANTTDAETADASSNATTAELLALRDRLLGPAYRLFYDKPLHIVRGQGVWLQDADGRRYLDVYNNVACVGHCRPEVIDAISAQARKLNTHTRYLHQNVLDYASRLGRLLPLDDPVCMFCCTGSEANELAYRIAMAHTGGRGVIVTEHAYHGNTSTVAQFSTADTPPARREDFVVAVPAPDSYRGELKFGDVDLGAAYAAEVDVALATLHHRQITPAAMLIDTVFSCDGIVTAPPGYLAAAARSIRAAGGLLIADEVQAGFGRTGEKFWGFERHDVVPDIVTLGKPMGNGHPVAAVITTRSIIAAFAQQIDYFNTFGGNPVSSAAGMAVLDVIEAEQLQHNAQEVGGYLKTRLHHLRARYEMIGDVRGTGLFLGVELVTDRSTKAPAAAYARQIVNQLRDLGVLTGVTGLYGNVLKVRPPLVFTRDNADLLLEALERILAQPAAG